MKLSCSKFNQLTVYKLTAGCKVEFLLINSLNQWQSDGMGENKGRERPEIEWRWESTQCEVDHPRAQAVSVDDDIVQGFRVIWLIVYVSWLLLDSNSIKDVVTRRWCRWKCWSGKRGRRQTASVESQIDLVDRYWATPRGATLWSVHF